MNWQTTKKMPNGAELIDCKQVEPDLWVVYCCWQGHAQPYVTWLCKGDGHCFWGHYFSWTDEAEIDYVKRYRALMTKLTPQ